MQPGFAQRPGDEDSGTTPQIRTHNVSPNGRIILDGIKHVRPSSEEMERYSLRQGDVVFNNTNSEEWVGKTAVFDQQGDFVFSNHMTRLRPDARIVDPHFLASYLHFLWSVGYSRTRAKRWVSQAGIEGAVLARFPLWLPTLPEQRRIVDIFRQAEAVSDTKHSISGLIDELVRTAYWSYFADWYSKDGLRDPVRISTYLQDTQYGISDPMGQTGSHAVLRMNNIDTAGWLDLSDLKYADVPGRDAEATRLQDGDLLFNRTNSRDLVGKCAIWRDRPEKFSFASYLVRLRLKQGMLPEYLWATLNSAYGKYRLLNAAKQAVSMANVSPTDLRRITVPLPPLPVQERFAEFVRNVETLRAQVRSRLDGYLELLDLVTGQAMLGELTESWREDHRAEIEAAAKARDALLSIKGVKPRQRSTDSAAKPAEPIAPSRPARQWLIGELSEFQRRLLDCFLTFTAKTGKPLLTEDPEAFSAFCEDDRLVEALSDFERVSPNRIGRTLSQLAELGLIAKLTLVKPNELTGQEDYLKAFRPVRGSEMRKHSDVEAFAALFSSSEVRYFYTVHLDYETSERAGAGGMFQVFSLWDGNDQDCTYLVDQGIHYATLKSLGADIARRLGVSPDQVDLVEV